MAATHASTEDIEEFRARARAWLAASMPRLAPGQDPVAVMHLQESDPARARQLQRRLYDGGFAGLVYPVEYGGQGLSRAHQHVFTDESAPYEMPVLFNVPTLTILGPTILDFGTEEQKARHLPAILRGDELWVQFLSEPSGGSDLAGLLTRATRDGDVWILNGSKIWSTGAHRADFALCLARTDWDAPKHRGLTMFIVEIHQPRIDLQQIRMVDESEEFCQEYFDDVVLAADSVVGQVNDGWTVASRLLIHERDAVGGGSPYLSGLSPGSRSGPQRDLLDALIATPSRRDERSRRLVAEAYANDIVHGQLIERITTAVEIGALPPPAGAIPRLYTGINSARRADIGLEILGSEAVAWSDNEPLGGQVGVRFLMRQAGSLGGGSTEMARNIISERVLGMPREYSSDRDKPFRDVPHNQVPTR